LIIGVSGKNFLSIFPHDQFSAPYFFAYTKTLVTLISETAYLISISQHFLLIKLIIVTVIGMTTHSFGVVPSPIYWFGALLVDLLMLLGCV
jgi:hypothetical protein